MKKATGVGVGIGWKPTSRVRVRGEFSSSQVTRATTFTQTTIHTYIHTYSQFRIASQPNMNVFCMRDKAGVPRENTSSTGRPWIFHTEGRQPAGWFKPRTLLTLFSGWCLVLWMSVSLCWLVCVKLACCPCACLNSYTILWLPLTVQRLGFRLIGNSKLLYFDFFKRLSNCLILKWCVHMSTAAVLAQSLVPFSSLCKKMSRFIHAHMNTCENVKYKIYFDFFMPAKIFLKKKKGQREEALFLLDKRDKCSKIAH